MSWADYDRMFEYPACDRSAQACAYQTMRSQPLFLLLTTTCCLLVGASRRSVAQDKTSALKSLMKGAAALAARDDGVASADDPDIMRRLQSDAFTSQVAEFGRWGHVRDRYSTWVNHSNRLIPVYTFGLDLSSLRDEGSAYANPERLKQLYGSVPAGTVNPSASYFDQTDIYRLQMAAVNAGKRRVIVMVFDGMDWQSTRNAAIYKTGRVPYERGRGTGLAFQDYRGVETDFGFVCTSAKLSNAKTDVNAQTVLSSNAKATGGYDPDLGGRDPWHERGDHDYLIGLDRERPHTVTDSASSATSMFAGIKTYNNAISVASDGEKVTPIARHLQSELGFKVGIVTSVPISHATLGAAYANNVSRKDYQDITRDMIGLRSSSHRSKPLPGVDVLIGGGWGETAEEAPNQGDNYVIGNSYLHKDDLNRVDVTNGGRYTVVQRATGLSGRSELAAAAKTAIKSGTRLLGFYGVKGGQLPFQTADGNFNPTVDARGFEGYTKADVEENPTLSMMSQAALDVLESKGSPFWLLIEAGDVDWANHSNNIDNSIGAVFSGESAFETVVNWVEERDAWSETALIVTADHGHYFVLQDPNPIARAGRKASGAQVQRSRDAATTD